MISLVLEAATYAGSAAVLRDGALLGERSVAMRGREKEALMPAVAELLETVGVAPVAIDRVVCGAGPGSFTSLRIAGGIAKGMAMATGAPLVPLSSLALLVASQNPLPPGRHLAAIDALRGEYYTELFEVDAQGLVAPQGPTLLVPQSALQAFADEHHAHLVAHTVVPRAAAAALLTNLIDATAPADLAGWEPWYGRLAEAQVKWEAAHGRPLSHR
ncbi:MAG: tRNA (adenosine(37)-N6)-threonylcarbamoyltransferase complex dimerization subunit type 1 TsaB [Gemmatimonadota bacterium]|nr:tRNA (adenosine(37)-N6)-threonylcarbamoyltransferase complex dimerization subunit type 1 TsaB [Gemmatimonadota bacterium]